MRHEGMRVTSPAWTLLDLAAVLPPAGLRRAVRQAQAMRLVHVQHLVALLARAGRRDDAMEALQAGLKYARRDVRLTIAMNKLTQRRSPILAFLGRKHPLNRQLGILRHRALRIFGQAS